MCRYQPKKKKWGKTEEWEKTTNGFYLEGGSHLPIHTRGHPSLFPFSFLSFPVISSLAEKMPEAAPLSCSHLLYVNQLANRSVHIDVDITTNRHLGT